MSEFTDKFFVNYLPINGAPFFDDLKELLCPGMNSPELPSDKKPLDLAIHCPCVIRCVEDILKVDGRNIIRDIENKDEHDETETNEDERKKSKAERAISDKMKDIRNCLDIVDLDEPEGKKMLAMLQIAALYHDIGKKIRSANHPRLGVNLLRYSNNNAQEEMVERLTMGEKEDIKKEHRFSLICSIVDHHDKFGVVSTGEGSLAIFSDILYFRSDKEAIKGINKNITSVMLVNLADIAAVCIADKNIELKKTAQETVYKILNNPSADNKAAYGKLLEIWQDKPKNTLMRLSYDKVSNILEDWDILIKATSSVDGARIALREYLVRMDQNPYRTMKRIIRLIKESCYTTGCDPLLKHITETDVESTLLSFFGSHQFQDFCIKFAYIVKKDYGLKFFKGIVCKCVREKTMSNSKEKDGWSKLNEEETQFLGTTLRDDERKKIVENITTIFIKVISEIIRRYNSILEIRIENAYRFGIQMRTLTDDDNVREKIIYYLCENDNKKLENVALTWIADEVTFWSMD